MDLDAREGKAQATPLTRVAVRALEKPVSKLPSALEATWDNTPIFSVEEKRVDREREKEEREGEEKSEARQRYLAICRIGKIIGEVLYHNSVRIGIGKSSPITYVNLQSFHRAVGVIVSVSSYLYVYIVSVFRFTFH